LASSLKHLPAWQQIGIALLFALSCVAVGAHGATVSPGGDTAWYANLEKPFFTPPSWLFGPVWTVLYVLMGVAAFLVLREGWHRREVRLALALFAVQLALNGAWTPVFFGMQSPLGGLVIIVLLMLVLAATLRQFLVVRPLAGWLLVPYLLWVGYATALNLAIYVMNRGG
jgi:translocator protein